MTPEECRHIRKNVLGLNQGDFARLLGVSRNTVVRWETGRVGIPHLRVGIIRQLEEEAKQRDQVDEWLRKLLALAVGGLFGAMLGNLFSKGTSDDAN